MLTRGGDADVVARAQAGDRAALSELLELQRPTIVRALLRFRLSPADREDLVQDISIRILLKIGSFTGGSALSTWVYRLTLNEAVDAIRARKRAPFDPSERDDDAPELESHGSRPDEALIQAEDRARLASAIAVLPPYMRETFEAHYGAGEPLDALAAALGLEPTTVRVRLHRARQRVRDALDSG